MKKYQLIRSFIILTISTILFIGIGCGNKDTGKIPITTSSNEALKLFMEGRDLVEKLQGQESLHYFEQAINLDSTFAMAYLYFSFNQPTVSGFFEQLETAIALEAKVSEAEQLWIEGVEAGANGALLLQQDFYTKLVSLYPNDERSHTLLGNNYFVLQEYDKAIAEYQKALTINPGYSPVYNQMGYSYRFLGNFEEAEKAFQKYIELIPDAPNPYDSYAELLMKMGRYDESITQYQKALEVNPNFVASHIGIATDYNFKGEYEKAREQLQKLFYIARDEGEQRAARFAMTVSFVDEGNYEKALEELQWQYELGKKTNDAPNMAGDLITIGNILLEEGKAKQAMKKFDEAYNTMEQSNLSQAVKDNASRFYLFNSGRVALKKKDMKKAKKLAAEFMKKAVEANSTFQIWAAHQLMGMIALQEKDYKTAVDELLQSNLQNPYNLYRLSLAYKAENDMENAKMFFEKAANDNTLNSIQYGFVRHKAKEMLEAM